MGTVGARVPCPRARGEARSGGQRPQLVATPRKQLPVELGDVWVEFRSDALQREKERAEARLGINQVEEFANA